MDWRGQGGSERYLDNPQKGYSLGLEHDIADLHQFVTTIVKRRGRSLFLFTASFGGHISLRYLHGHPKSFDFAVLVSPMFDIYTGKWPRWIARLLAKLATVFGFGESYTLGGGDWQPDAEHDSYARKVSSDPVRYSVSQSYFRERPELRLGSPTYRWLNVVFDSISKVSEPAYLEAIHTPLLITSSLKDEVVVPAAQERACGLIPNCRLLRLPGARHVLSLERDEFRVQLFDAFDRFAAEMLAQSVR
jgi:lysophospholipase